MVEIYSYNRMNDVGCVTADDYFNVVVYENGKEDEALRFMNDEKNNTGTDQIVVINNVTSGPSGKKVLGFWIKVLALDTVEKRFGEVIWKNPDNGHYMRLDWAYDTGDSRYEWFISVNGEYSTRLGLNMEVPLNTWIFWEFVWESANTQKFYRNGSLEHTFANHNVQIGSSFEVKLKSVYSGPPQDFGFGDVVFDIFMIKDDIEYPPSYPPKGQSTIEYEYYKIKFIPIEYKESISSYIPVKKIPYLEYVKTDTDCYSRTLKHIYFTARFTLDDFVILRDLPIEKTTVKLNFDDALIYEDCVLIEMRTVWAKMENSEKPYKISFHFIY